MIPSLSPSHRETRRPTGAKIPQKTSAPVRAFAGDSAQNPLPQRPRRKKTGVGRAGRGGGRAREREDGGAPEKLVAAEERTRMEAGGVITRNENESD